MLQSPAQLLLSSAGNGKELHSPHAPRRPFCAARRRDGSIRRCPLALLAAQGGGLCHGDRGERECVDGTQLVRRKTAARISGAPPGGGEGSRRAPREARAVGEASEGFAVAPQRRRPRRRRMRGDGARQHRLHIPAARPSAKCRLVRDGRSLAGSKVAQQGLHEDAVANMHAFLRKC